MTYAAIMLSGFPDNHVIGSGTLLDSARFRQLIGKHCKVAPGNVHAYIIGEHGDSEVPLWSTANIAGLRLDEYCPVCGRACDMSIRTRIFEEVRDAAYAVIERKGATYYAIALALAAVTRAILRDENAVMTVSCLIDGFCGATTYVFHCLQWLTAQGSIAYSISPPLHRKNAKASSSRPAYCRTPLFQ